MARYTRPVYNVADVFAAAAAAHRMNGSYLKSDDITFHEDGVTLSIRLLIRLSFIRSLRAILE